MAILKPFLTYEQQLDRLINYHKLSVSDKQRALRVLSEVNYYRLSAYGIGLYQKHDPEQFLPHVTFDHIYRLYQFDAQLRNALMPVIEVIEIELRTRIAHYFCQKYGAEGYTDPNNFVKKQNKNGVDLFFIQDSNIHREIDRRSSVPFIKHHIDNYNGQFPLWVLIDIFSFGMLSSFYALMHHADQKAVAALYGLTDAKTLNGWIRSLCEIRNICAHYSRLYNMPLSSRPKLFKEHQQYAKYRLFPVVLVISRLAYNKPEWTTF